MTANSQPLHRVLSVAQHFFVIGLFYHLFHLSSSRDPSFWNTWENRSEPSPSQYSYSPWTLLSSQSGLVTSGVVAIVPTGFVGGSVEDNSILSYTTGNSHHKCVYHCPDSSFPPPAQKCIQAGRAVSDHHTLPFWHRKQRAAFFPFHHMMTPVFHPVSGKPVQVPLRFPLASSTHPAKQTGQGKAVFSCSTSQPAQQGHSPCRGTA